MSFIPVSLTVRATDSISLRTNLENSEEVILIGSTPSFENSFLNSGVTSERATSFSILSTILVGIAAGPHKPHQWLYSKPARPASADVRTQYGCQLALGPFFCHRITSSKKQNASRRIHISTGGSTFFTFWRQNTITSSQKVGLCFSFDFT